LIPLATSLAAVARPFTVLLVDVWGVVHNGVAPFDGAVKALAAARASRKRVILISNAPRLADEIPPQFARIGVPGGIYDAIVTSGDATREIIKAWSSAAPLRLYHLGPSHDDSVFKDLAIERVPLAQASHVVCTGLFDDETETPADYETLLREIAARGLPFLCANPDIVVQRGERLIYCAGALAQRLKEMGGSVIYPGKPHAPIYELAMARAQELAGRAVAKSELLAIGDGLSTDILGAEHFGIASLFVLGGIHRAEFAAAHGIDAAKIAAACARLGVRPIAAMPELAP
jgi:HAD superfamily hydrolase (TIGR01459 family)